MLKAKDRVRKTSGDYHCTGTVLAAFETLAGKLRVVVELDEVAGLLHIFSPSQLTLIEEKKKGRTKAEVIALRSSVVGCCDDMADHKWCSCLEEAE